VPFNTHHGNDTDFEAAAFPYLDELYRTARRLTGSSTEAEDIVQETYLQAWQSFHRFESGTNCRAWLHKILFHVVQHHRRKSFRLVLKKDDDDTFEENLPYEPPIPEHLPMMMSWQPSIEFRRTTEKSSCLPMFTSLHTGRSRRR
jgi:RNA polymerase sigma factor (sigma-70 family)